MSGVLNGPELHGGGGGGESEASPTGLGGCLVGSLTMTGLPVSESEASECGAHWNEACPGPTLDPLHDERQVVNGGL